MPPRSFCDLARLFLFVEKSCPWLALLLLPGLLLVSCAGQPGATPPESLSASITTSSPALTPVASSAPQRSYEVTVWSYYASGVEMTTLLGAPDLIREVNFFWYELGSNGQIVGSLQTPGALEKLRAAGTRIVPSIMNDFSAERVHTMVSDPQKRSAHIQDLLALVVENGYDGIDIDYESMYAEDRENFTLFIEELAQVFHANGKLLSIAVHAKVDDEGAWAGAKAQDWARLGAAVDMFKIMTYDYHNAASEAGPIAPISWVDQVLAYAATVVPAEKTYLGLPVYGYEWFLSQAKSLRWDGAQAIVNRTGAQIQRDESNEAWFQYDSGGQHTVYFIDALSTETKLRAILGRYPHLAGVAIWVLGGEDPQTWEAIRRVYAEIEE